MVIKVVQDCFRVLADFLAVFQDAGVLETYMFTYSIANTHFQKKEEDILKLLINFINTLKVVLECATEDYEKISASLENIGKLAPAEETYNAVICNDSVTEVVEHDFIRKEANEESNKADITELLLEGFYENAGDSCSGQEATEQSGEDCNLGPGFPVDSSALPRITEVQKPPTPKEDGWIQREGRYTCLTCGSDFAGKKGVMRHMKKHTGELQFQCATCHRHFSTKAGLVGHQAAIHGEQTHLAHCCCYCGKLFGTRSNLNAHQEHHEKRRPYVCELCSRRFSQKGSLTSHMRAHAGQRDHSCLYCDRTFVTRSKLNEHLHQHQPPRFTCNVCQKNFVRHDRLRAHARTHTDVRPFECSQCGRKFRTQSNLKYHLQTHSTSPQQACVQCGAQFRHQRSLVNHLEKMHGVVSRERLLCAACGLEFNGWRSLKQHELTHSLGSETQHSSLAHEMNQQKSLELQSECCETLEACSLPQNISDTPPISSQKQSYGCHLCPRRYTQKSKLTEHLKVHLQEPSHCCPVCGRQFHRRDALERHTLVHSGQRPFVCAQCGKAFALKSNLSVHLQTHAGPDQRQAFTCSECGRNFQHRSSLALHRKTHSNQYSYTCATCGKQFMKRSHYESHARTHQPNRPFSCTTCGKSYKERKHCRQHSRQAHPSEMNLEALIAAITCDDSEADPVSQADHSSPVV